MPKLALGLAVIAALTIGPALLQGRYANRWREPAELLAAADAIETFPKALGAWEMSDAGTPLTDRVVRELGLAGYVTRYYKHRESGDLVLMMLMVGRPGPLVRHPPDICFGNLANTLTGESQLELAKSEAETGGAVHRFRVLAYEPHSKLEEPFRVAYAFTADGAWEAPAWPRWTFGANASLFKAHLQALEPREETPEGKAALEEFAREFVPAFARFRAAIQTPEK